MSIFLIGAHFFQQSRGSIVSLMAVLILLLWLSGEYKKIMAMASVGVLAILLSGIFMEENILLTPFSTTVDDVSEKTGTVGARIIQVEMDFDQFKKHPIIGSGLIAVRSSVYGRTTFQREYMAALTRTADLGYTHWIKMYGVIGIIWLLVLYWGIKKSIGKALKLKSEDDKSLALFCTGYMLFIVISAISLNHFLIDERIVLLCLMLAILRLITVRPITNP